MREHAEAFKGFINVNAGGGLRRNPKRKNARGYSNNIDDFTPPSQADIDRSFENHLQQMAQGGTYGDNMEISAFSAAYGYIVKIHQREFAFVINNNAEGLDLPVAHVAYHVSGIVHSSCFSTFTCALPRLGLLTPLSPLQTWEHYSSVRNIKGPFTGLPCVHEAPVSPAAAKAAHAKAADIVIPPWMVATCLNSLPFPADHATIHKTLVACKADLNAAVSRLIESNEERLSISGNSQGSSSVERDIESDDEAEYAGPKKKQDRRLSRATRSKHGIALTTVDGKEKAKQSKLTVNTKSKSVVHQPPTPALADFPKRTSVHQRRITARRIVEDSDDDYKEDDESSVGNSPASTSMTSKSPTPETKLPNSPAFTPIHSGVRLRLSQPKLPTATASDNSAPTRYQGTARPSTAAKPGPAIKLRVTARDRKDAKKAAQKAAAKDRKKPGIKAGTAVVNGKGAKEGPSPGMEVGIKTLYI